MYNLISTEMTSYTLTVEFIFSALRELNKVKKKDEEENKSLQ